MKKKLSVRKIILLVIFIIIVDLIVIGINSYNFSKTNTSTTEFENLISTYRTDYEYLAMTEDGEYIISHAPANISFEVTEGTTFGVVDEDNKLVAVSLCDLKIINKSGYEKGKEYTLTISNGSFTSEQLKDTKKVKFKIERDKVQEYKFNTNTKKIDISKLQLKNNVMLSEEKYNIDDVILIYDEEKFIDAYIIKKIKDSSKYDVEKATINQIFEEIDYYDEGYVDLSSYQLEESLKEYLIAQAETSKWYSFILSEVKAAPKIKIETTKTENGIKAKVSVTISAGENCKFASLKHHNFTFSYSNEFNMKKVFDIDEENWDAEVQLTVQQNFDFKIDNKDLNFKADGTRDFAKKIKQIFEKGEKSDTTSSSVNLFMIPITTPIPGLNVDLELDFINQIKMTVDFDLNAGTLIKINAGFDYGKNEKFKPIYSVDVKLSNLKVEFNGKLEDKCGLKLTVELSLVGVVEGGISCFGGLYGKVSLSMKEDLINKKLTLNTNVDSGVFVDLNLEAKFLDFNYSHTLFSKSISFYTNGKSVTYDYENNKVEESTSSGGLLIDGAFKDDSAGTSEKKDNYIVRFDTKGGSIVEPQQVKAGEKVKKPQNPTKENYYSFTEWTLNGKPYDFNTPVNSDIILTASWKDDLGCDYDGEITDGTEFVDGQFTYYYNKEYYKASWRKTKVEGWSVQVTEDYTSKPITTKLCRSINNIPIVSMSNMFAYINSRSIDLSTFETSNVINMSDMFAGTKANVDLCQLETENVKDMSGMFSHSSMESLDLSCLNTHNVTDMSEMFYFNSSKNINLTNLNTSNVTLMSSMFVGTKAKKLNVSSFNTSNVEKMDFMFSRSEADSIEGLENFNTQKVENMGSMFSHTKVPKLNLSSFSTKKANFMDSMFEYSSVEELDLTSFTVPDTHLIWSTSRIFSDSKIKNVYVSDLGVSSKFIETINGEYDTSDDNINIILK